MSISQSAICHVQCDYNHRTAKADCSSLNLDCIPINYPYAIVMDLSHNNISMIEAADFNGTFSRLVELYLDYNNITDVTPLMESTQMGSLQKLSVQHNVISNLDSTCQLSSLTDFSVDYNLLTYLSIIPRCDVLQRFTADFNSIEHVSYPFIDNILSNSIISLQFNRLRVFLIEVLYLHVENITLLLDYNEITRFRIDSIIHDYIFWETISLSHNRLNRMYLRSVPITLNLDSNGLHHFDSLKLNNGQDVIMKNISLRNNSFDSLIQPDWAEGLEFLDADNNVLPNLSTTTLQGFINLMELHIANNHLLFILPSALSQLTMLRSLYLDGNALTSLFGGVFFKQSNLTELSMTYNQLTMLHPDYFIGLVSLERLYLEGNQLVSVNAEMFRQMPQIIMMDISKNVLQVFDLEDCDPLTNLRNLSLAHNSIYDVSKTLGFCDNLEILDMSFNRIQVVPGDSLSGRNRALSMLKLEGNPLQCDCRLTSLRDWLRNNPPSVLPRCEGPRQHYGAVITDLNIHDFSCKPPKAMTDVKDLQVVIGQTATLSCTTTGIPAPNVTWLDPNGTKISHEWQGRFAIIQEKILHITSVKKSDQGIFTCLAENVLGEMDRAVVNVTVTNLRSPPISLAVSVLPTICITIAITMVVVGLIFCLRQRYKKEDQVNSKASDKIPDLKVGFRKGETTHPDGGCVKVEDEVYLTPISQQTKRDGYAVTVGTGNPSQDYEEPRSVNRDGDGYETMMYVPRR